MTRIVRIAFVLGLAAIAHAQPPASYQVQDYGITPIPARKPALINLPAVQDELKLTEAQKQAMAPQGLRARFMEKMQATRRIDDRQKQMAAIQAVQEEMETALLEPLDPGQRERLDQIQIQIQGPAAFLQPEFQKRIALTAEQVAKIGPVVAEGQQQIQKASSVTLPPDLKFEDKAGSLEAIRKQLESPEFKATLGQARKRSRDAWESRSPADSRNAD